MDLYNKVPWLEQNTIYMCYGGSRAYGTATPTSDVDIRGIFIPPIEYYYGLDTVESFHVDNGEDDVVFYSLKKIFQLAMANNPNILDILFCDPSARIKVSPAGEKLLEMRHMFLSKRVYNTYAGYSMSQFGKMLYRDGAPNHGQGNPERQAIRQEFGYDTKNAMHLVRIMRMGVEILRDHEVNVCRPDAKELLDIRAGKYPMDQIFQWNDELYGQLQYWRDNTNLPDEPDKEVINKILVDITEEYFHGRDER